jgi:hypothetical protein
LPSGYKFGITAATPDTPDSFELFKFLVTQGARTSTPPPGQQQQQQQQPIQPRSSNGQAASERPAADYTISQSQFVDLRNGIQQLSSAVNDIYREISQLAQNGENRHQELLRNQPTGDAPALGDQRYNGLNSRLQRIENILQSLQRDSDYRNQFAQLHKAIESSHHSLTEALQTSIFNSKPRSVSLQPRSPSTFTVRVANSFLLFFFSFSDQRRYTANGSFHLPHHCRPVRSGSRLHLLQTSPQQHAEEVLVIIIHIVSFWRKDGSDLVHPPNDLLYESFIKVCPCVTTEELMS